MSTRRGFIAGLFGASVLAGTAAVWTLRSGAQASRPPLLPQALPEDVALTGNLVLNPGFELDAMGATFTSWTPGTPLATGTEGIPPTL
ncbi:MAG: hypothetical protein F2772_12510 [Actinobacteria bacterium]|uniref:Unannotated protein n=1 Tax=freshwater metagenome TaxID=449393 RepID=A0A6J7MGR9_9ZZZZ|nr:hypothetical protein [Actinomycetota bacterium]MSX56341.1 hypothetical protein [Actinomycetota bacterium]MTB16835.1 hypothetical protein [Actinomycetota bacterium]